MVSFLLLAMQAAGMVTDYLGTKNQSELMTMGMKVQQAGIEAELETTALQSQEASLLGMKQLRQNLGTQIAVNAARGTRSNAGSAFSLLNESVSNFNSDERVRKLNLLSRQTQLKGNNTIANLQYSGDSSKLWQSFAQRTVNRFPTSVSGWQGFGLTSTSGA